MRYTERVRESIVTLTQTEIMLVLATVILLLLLLSNRQLDDTAEERDHLRSAFSSLIPESELGDDPQEASERILTQVNLAEEVNETLVRAGLADTEVAGGLTQADVDAVSELVQEREQARAKAERQDQINAGLRNALAESGILNESGSEELTAEELTVVQEKLEALTKSAASAQRTPTEVLVESLPNDLPEALAKALLSDVQARLDGRDGNAVSNWVNRQEIGFVPCWPGVDEGRRYYFAYDFTYREDGKFEIRSHADWNSGIEPLHQDLDQELAILRSYPRSVISSEELAVWGKEVQAMLRSHWRGPSEPWRAEGCELAVTINEKGKDLGVVTKFIRSDVGFYPVWR